MSETVLVAGARDVRASLDHPAADACVVACPPHPRMGGSRTDERLEAVSAALAPDAATLRFDYGPWDEGEGELVDARNALAWARDEYATVGLFGFSFGGCLALLAAARESRESEPPAAVAALAPGSRISGELDAVADLETVDCPVGIVYGERDTTADWEPVVERARALGATVEAMSADHFFVGQASKAADRIAGFLREQL
jgi:alpha/beta superfamily hydrolase